ncbi:hypothetical protein TWF281_006347 [Arthrobotrys megalospora]
MKLSRLLFFWLMSLQPMVMAALEEFNADIDGPDGEDSIQWAILIKPGLHKDQRTERLVFEIKAIDKNPTYFEGGDPIFGYWWFSFSCTKKVLDEIIKKRHPVIASWKPLVDTYDYRDLPTLPPGVRRGKLKRTPIEELSISPRSISANASNPLGKRDIILQYQAPRDLRAMSLPGWIWSDPDPIKAWWQERYKFDRYPGTEAVMYVICKGYDINHDVRSLLEEDEFSYLPDREKKNWLWSRPFPAPQNVYRDYSWGHGTAIMSKVLGKTVGVARPPWRTVVVVNCDKNGKTSRIHILDSLYKVWADVDALKRSYRGRSIVVSLSSGFFYEDDGEDPQHHDRETFDKYLQMLILEMMEEMGKLGIKFIVPVGSRQAFKKDGPSSPDPLSFFPAQDGVTPKYKGYIIVVGGVEMNNWLNYYQTNKGMEIWAPARDIKVALTGSPFNKLEIAPASESAGYGLVNGPCYAAATTAGLLAYYISLGLTATEAIDVLLAYAYPRDDRAGPVGVHGPFQRRPQVIFNGARDVCPPVESTRFNPVLGPLTREFFKNREDELKVRLLRRVDDLLKVKRQEAGIVHVKRNLGTARRDTDMTDDDDGGGGGYDDDEVLACPLRSSSSSSSSSTTDVTSGSSSSTATDVTSSSEEITSTAAETTATPTTEPPHTSTRGQEEDEEEDEEEDDPPGEDEPVNLEPAKDDVLIGEMSLAADLGYLLYVIPPGVGTLILLTLPAIDGKNITTRITLSEYQSKTVTFTDINKIDLQKLGFTTTSSSSASTTATTGTTTHPPSTTASQTSSAVPRTTSTIPSPTPTPKGGEQYSREFCFGVNLNNSGKRWVESAPGPDDWRYVNRDNVARLIDSDAVCGDSAPDLSGGKLYARFYEDSPEEVLMYVWWDQTIMKPPTKAECRDNFFRILDGCDGNDPLNPWNWKAGGERRPVPGIVYAIEPKADFRRPPGPVWVACRFWVDRERAHAKVWGYGFADAFQDIDTSVNNPYQPAKGQPDFREDITLKCPYWDGSWVFWARTTKPRSKARWEWSLGVGWKPGMFFNRFGRASKECLERHLRRWSGIQDLVCGDKDWDEGVTYR